MAQEDQVPLGSGFGAKSTGAEVLAGRDLAGLTAIVTGGYSGIGLQTASALADKGVRVVVPVRTPEKARAALADLSHDIDSAALDLADLRSIRDFADDMRERLDRLDLLICNAGIMAPPLARTSAGWESQFGVNHMGHFALTRALMPLIARAPAPRVVALSSTGHKIGGIRWHDPHWTAGDYDKWQAYGQSKTANALFANALSRRLGAAGGLAFAVHPGGIFTPLQRHLPKEEMIALGWLGADGEPSEAARAGFKTPEQGCATTLWAATAPELAGKPGVYCEDCDIAAPTDPDSPMTRYRGVNAHASDDDAAERLWTLSETLLAAA